MKSPGVDQRKNPRKKKKNDKETELPNLFNGILRRQRHVLMRSEGRRLVAEETPNFIPYRVHPGQRVAQQSHPYDNFP